MTEAADETAKQTESLIERLAGQPEKNFSTVLLHELQLVAARRKALKAGRGELDGTTAPPPDQPHLETAWKARLVGLAFSGGGIRSATFNLGVRSRRAADRRDRRRSV